jgi:hypothetical protein
MAKVRTTTPQGPLISSFDQTSLDLTNPNPLGGPNNAPIPYYVSPNSTGTPTTKSNPGPFKGFVQAYTPQNPYLNSVNNKSVKTSALSAQTTSPEVLSITNLDNSQPGVNGGVPYKTVTDPTNYPTTTQAKTPIRGYFAEPGEAAHKYGSNPTKVYTANNTYLQQMFPLSDGSLPKP